MYDQRRSQEQHGKVTLPLREIAAKARDASAPIRAWRDEGERYSEVYFYRDFVIHADFRGFEGSEAVREMLHRDELRYRVDVGVWPSRHTLLLEWTSLRRAPQ